MTLEIFARNLGILIREGLKIEKVSQENLAATLGVHRNTVNRWIMGGGIPDAYQLYLIEKVCKAQFDVRDDDVFITQGVSPVVQ